MTIQDKRRPSIVLCARVVVLVFALSACLAEVAAEPFEKYYEPPEDVVVKALYISERCAEAFPFLRSDMGKAFAFFEQGNQPYFDATRRLPHFQEGYKLFKERYAALELTESGCRQTIELLASPASRIKEKSVR